MKCTFFRHFRLIWIVYFRLIWFPTYGSVSFSSPISAMFFVQFQRLKWQWLYCSFSVNESTSCCSIHIEYWVKPFLRRKIRDQNNEMFKGFLDLSVISFIVVSSSSDQFWFEAISCSAQTGRTIVPKFYTKIQQIIFAAGGVSKTAQYFYSELRMSEFDWHCSIYIIQFYSTANIRENCEIKYRTRSIRSLWRNKIFGLKFGWIRFIAFEQKYVTHDWSPTEKH